MRSLPRLALVGSIAFGATLVVFADPWPRLAIPAQNAASAQRPTPRPPPGDVGERARHVFQALRDGTAASEELALDFFLPRDPFLAIKDMHGAASYHSTLVRAFRQDLAAYRRARPRVAQAEFVRFELSRACTWMAVGREANRLPYWSCYQSRLVLRWDGREQPFEARVMINWGERWYCTHLAPRARRDALDTAPHRRYALSP